MCTLHYYALYNNAGGKVHHLSRRQVRGGVILKHSWRAFLVLTVVMIALMLAITTYWAGMGYFQMDRKEVVETHPWDKDLELEVINDMGDVKVYSWDESKIEIKGTKKTLFGAEELDKIDLHVEKQDTFRITTKRDKDSPWVWMDLTVYIPAEMTVKRIEVNFGILRLEGAEGNISLTNRAGRILVYDSENLTRVRSNAGDVRIKNVQRIESLESDVGDIEITQVEFVGDVRSDAGDIKLTNIGHIDYVRADAGNVKCENCGIISRVDAEAGDIDLDLMELDENGLDVRNSAGDIKVSFPVNSSFDFELYTDAGDLRITGFYEDNVTFRYPRDKEKRGQVNEGGPLVRLETDSGDITLEGKG
ncbi:MAG: DUF4097 family beta strand repeat-containing protein [Thermoplasmatota archaeon]